MNTWNALYLKELKDIRTLFILLALVTVFLEVVAVLSFTGEQSPPSIKWPTSTEPGGVAMSSDDLEGMPSFHFLWSLVPYSFLLILPFLLGHSFAQEVKGQTHYQLLSLPVSRARIFAAKAAAVATLGIVIFALGSAGLIVVLGELLALAARVPGVRISPFSAMDVLVVSGVVYFSAMALMLGIGGGAAGVKLVVRRFAGLASAAFVIFVLYCYFSLLPEVLSLSGMLGAYEMPFPVWSETTAPGGGAKVVTMLRDSIKVDFMIFAWSIFVGLAAMGVGMWLFEKRAEA